MATLGQTQVEEREVATSQQLSGAIFRAKDLYEETGDEKYKEYGKRAFQELKKRGDAEYHRVIATRQLGADPSSVNATVGADLKTRLGYTLLDPGADGVNRQLYLQRKFGRDNVRTVRVDGQDRDWIKRGNEWTPVDEVGLTASDFSVDFARDLPQVVAEIGVAALTSGSTHLPRLMRFAAPAVAGYIEKVVQDVAMSEAMGIDADVGHIATTEGAWSLAGLGAEGGVRLGSKLITSKLPSDEVQIFKGAIDQLKRDGLPMLAENAKVKGGWIRKPFIETSEKFEQALRETQDALVSGSRSDFETALRSYSENLLNQQNALARQVASEGATNQKATIDQINALARRRVDALGTPPPDAPHVRGSNIRESINSAYGVQKREADRLFNIALRSGDNSGLTVGAKNIDEDILETIANSGLPMDRQKELIVKYAPAAVKRWKGGVEKAFRGKVKKTKAQKQVDSLLKALGEEVDDEALNVPVDLSFRDLYDLRGSIRRDIKFDVAADGVTAGPAQPTLKRIDGVLSDHMDSLAKEGGFADEFGAANKHFQEKVMPYRRGDILSVRKGRDAAGYVTDDNVMDKLLYGRNAADNVREIIRVEGANSPIVQHIKDELGGRIIAGSRLPGGWVDIGNLGKLVDATNPAVWDAVYGKGSSKRLKRLKNVVNLNNFDARKGDPRLMEAYFNATTDREASEVLKRIRSYATSQVQNAKYQNKVVKHVIERGDPKLVDPDTVSGALVELDPTELRAFFDTMPDAATHDAFKNAMLTEIVGRSRTHESGEAIRAFANGHDLLVDPKVLLANLSDKKMLRKLRVVMPEKEIRQLKSFAQTYGAFTAWAARNPRKVSLGISPYLRTGADGNIQTRLVVTGHPALDTAIRSVIEKGAPMSDSYKLLWTTLVGMDDAMASTLQQMSQDPEYKQYVIENFQSLMFDKAESPNKEAPAN
jgi:hypothetical protein